MAENDPLHENYWKRPALDMARQGDSDEMIIYTTVGIALDRWESAEEMLRIVFLKVCRSESAGATSAIIARAWGAIGSTSGKLSVLKAAAEVHFMHYWHLDNVRRPFESLTRAVEKAGHRRNEIAHGRLKHFRGSVDNKELYDRGLFLAPPNYIAMHNTAGLRIDIENPLTMSSAKYLYTSIDILAFAEKFSKLSEALFRYSLNIGVSERGVPLCAEVAQEKERLQIVEKTTQQQQRQKSRQSQVQGKQAKV